VRVLLVSANTERLNLTTLPLGLAQVAAAVRAAGHEAVLLDLLAAAEPLAALRTAVADLDPEAIGVSVRNVDDQERLRPDFLLDRVRPVVAACRALSAAPVVLGGAGYSIFPDAALADLGADLGVRGEGERVFPALLDAMAAGADPALLPGVHAPGRSATRRQPQPVDLSLAPPPWDDLLPAANLAEPGLWVPIQTRRGCPLDCSYCSTPLIEGRTPRWRSPERVVADVLRLAAAGAPRLYFVDNTFNLPAAYALELCRRLEAAGAPLPWRAIVYPGHLPAELPAAMASAGCVEVSLGFESGSDPVLRNLGKRFTAAEARRAAAGLAAAGIRRWGFLLLGGPGETRDSVRESLDFADSLALEGLRLTAGIRVYPGTPLHRTALAEGVVRPDEDLLRPRFYLAPGLEGWVDDLLAARSP
jgi:radical SAM superfamily enzyme YgiQ (UPF0313 family)